MAHAWWWKAGIAGIALGAAATSGMTSCKAELEFGCEDGNCSSGASTSGAGGAASCVPVSHDSDTHGYPADVYGILQTECFGCHGDPLNGAPRTMWAFDDTQALFPVPPDGPNPLCAACVTPTSTPDEVKQCLDSVNAANPPSNPKLPQLCRVWWAQMLLHAIPDPAHAGDSDAGYDEFGRFKPGMPNGKPPIPDCEVEVLKAWLQSCQEDPSDFTSLCKCTMGPGTPAALDQSATTLRCEGMTTSSTSASSSSSSSVSSASASASSSSTDASSSSSGGG
jgi:hypothetical protein